MSSKHVALTEQVKLRLKELRAQGLSLHKIAKETGVAYNIVTRELMTPKGVGFLTDLSTELGGNPYRLSRRGAYNE